jgi:hypothetical protein
LGVESDLSARYKTREYMRNHVMLIREKQWGFLVEGITPPQSSKKRFKKKIHFILFFIQNRVIIGSILLSHGKHGEVAHAQWLSNRSSPYSQGMPFLAFRSEE